MGAWSTQLDTLVRECGPRLFGYAYALTGSTADAEDLLQSALIKVFSRPRQLRSTQAAESYVRKAMWSVFIDDKRLARHRHEVGGIEADAAQADSTSQVTSRLALHAALLALPPRQRLCLVLRFYDGMSMADIGRELGIAPGTVRKYVHDGLARLGDEARSLGLSADDIDDDHVTVTVVSRKEG